jgi:cell wall-associated NlpC family hydrolase
MITRACPSRLMAVLAAALLAACSVAPPQPQRLPPPGSVAVPEKHLGNEIVMFSFGLIDTGYRFGGRNPDSGLDCSGMVSYIYEQVAGLRLPHNAAQIARQTRPIERDALRPGDLVFFNTRNFSYSHVGIYIGDDRFVHAPNRNGRVRIDRLSANYYAERFDAARTVFVD